MVDARSLFDRDKLRHSVVRSRSVGRCRRIAFRTSSWSGSVAGAGGHFANSGRGLSRPAGVRSWRWLADGAVVLRYRRRWGVLVHDASLLHPYN